MKKINFFPVYFSLTTMVLFVLFYALAALNYPGGSWIAPQQQGFSFWHNYLCDLLDEYAVNGVLNTSRFYARASLTVLCSGLLVLWYHLPYFFQANTISLHIMRFTGLTSLFILFLLAVGNHDTIVHISGFFGLIALLICFKELYKSGHRMLFLVGILCLFIFLFNYYSYETGSYIESLPLIQKITFVLFLTWFIMLDISFYRKLKSKADSAQDGYIKRNI